MSPAKQRILDTAAGLFGERGYRCVGINEIIAKAGVAKATFYLHFPSKEQLCLAWLEREAGREGVLHAELLADGRPVRERVEERFDALKAKLKATGFRGCPFGMTAAVTEAGGEVRGRIAEARARTRRFWRELAAQHEPSAKRAKDLGDAWFLLHSGALAEARNVRSLWPVKRARRAALALGGWQ